MRLAAYGAISTSLATAVILAAFQQRPNFYSACVYLSQSNACLMILTNMGIFLTILFGFTVQKIFFGHLRAIEEAHLRERTWFAVTETFLAMTVFRDEFNTRFVVMFVSLLFVKCFHWICQDRIDYMEQFPTIPWHFHVRMVSAMLVFLAADIAFISHAIDITIRYGASMMIMFGFEFILLAATIIAIFVKYILNVIDSRHSEAWENRSIYMFYLELATDFFKLITYLAFFSIILTYYGLPLHIIRDVYITLRSFAKKLMSFIRYRQATAHMNERYPDATAEELEATGDRTCIICREQMVHGGEAGRERTRPKKLRCGHILHFHCLRSWLERQQSCPTCRRPVLEETRTPPPTRGLVPPAPPMPAQAPMPIPIQGPAAVEAPPAVPGPTPAPSARTMPRLVASGPITLPPGYVLPPGWAVIPAQNVQIVPPGAPNVSGVQNVQVVEPQLAAQNFPGVPGPAPNGAGTAERNGDVISPPVMPAGHVAPSTPTTTRSDISESTNISPPSTSTPSNPTDAQNNPNTMNANGPNVMHRPPPPRFWAAQPAHPAFPAAIPLVGNIGQTGFQFRAAPMPPSATASPGTSAPPSSFRTNGATSDGRRETDEQAALLQQMGESVRMMQNLVSRMSTLLPSPNFPSSTIESTQSWSPNPPQAPQPSTSRTEPTLSNGHAPASEKPPPLHIKKRRSFTPIERTDENEHSHTSRVRRLSSSEDDLSPEELADIRAPWVESPVEDGLPLTEIPRQGSPPRIRSPSRSPSRTLLRRGSLLKHDITNEISDTEGDTQENKLDKGKGREVFVEDVPEGE